MNWFKKLFTQQTNYAPQVLSPKQKAIIEALDEHLVKHCTASITNTNAVIKSVKIGLFYHHYGVGMILGHIRAAIATEGYGYIPRSIALITDPDGTWSFYFALRTTDAGADDTTVELFSNALARTNDAR
jgi:hypothetical protein